LAVKPYSAASETELHESSSKATASAVVLAISRSEASRVPTTENAVFRLTLASKSYGSGG
jgi:hypothetical protein